MIPCCDIEVAALLYHKVMNSDLNSLQTRLQKTISAAELTIHQIPDTQVHLYLLTDDYPRGPLPHDEMLAVLREPAYWAFCWASGQVLTRYVLANSDLFKGKSVLDFGAGSGVVGIAAALAGASKVICCDIDPIAIHASQVNAELNGVSIETLDDLEKMTGSVDWVIAADVLYDRENLPWVDKLQSFGTEVLIADSRVKEDVLGDYHVVDKVVATTIPDLDEFKEFNTVRIYRGATEPSKLT